MKQFVCTVSLGVQEVKVANMQSGKSCRTIAHRACSCIYTVGADQAKIKMSSTVRLVFIDTNRKYNIIESGRMSI